MFQGQTFGETGHGFLIVLQFLAHAQSLPHGAIQQIITQEIV